VSANTNKDLIPNLPSTREFTLEMTRRFVGRVVLLGYATEHPNIRDGSLKPVLREEIQAVTIQALQVRSWQCPSYTQSFSVFLEPAGSLCFNHGTIDYIAVDLNDPDRATVHFKSSNDHPGPSGKVVTLTVVSNEEGD